MLLGRVVLPNEPQWTSEDRDKVAAFAADKAARCTGCGMHEDETSIDGMPLGLYQPTTYQCFVCTSAENTYSSIPSEHRAGVTVRLMRSVSE